MPHSGVQIKVDRGGGVAVFCGSTDIGQGSDSRARLRGGGGAGHPAGGHPRGHRRHRPHAGGPRLVLVARHAHDGQRRASRPRASVRAPIFERRRAQARGAGRAAARRRPADLGRGRPLARAALRGGGGAGGSRVRHAGRGRLLQAADERSRSWKGAGVGPTPTYSYSAAAVELSADRETGIIRVDKVWIAHDVGRSINPLLVIGQVEGSVYMGLGEALMEEQVFRQGPAQDPVHARVQEPDHAGDAARGVDPGRDARPRGPLRREGVRPGAAAARDPRRGQRALRRARRAHGRGADHAREGAGRARGPLPPAADAGVHLSGDGGGAAARAGGAGRPRGGRGDDARCRRSATSRRRTAREAARDPGRPRPGGHGGGGRDRPLPEHEAPAVHAEGAGGPARPRRRARASPPTAA